ncbi:putative 5'-AMP-activated protein kinase subunit beta-1 family protein [Cryptosporidium felis]|nr:putative 5'-AMP-activated protein kinase subunit beta-1 family protein [Cryptosporidium felis]
MGILKSPDVELETGIESCNRAHDCQYNEAKRDCGIIHCVIRWTFGGEEVFVTGCFNSWKKLQEYRLFKCGHDHVIVIELTRDIHFFKFIVDGEWRYSPEHPVNSDCEGFVNNYIDLRRYQKLTFSKCSKSQDNNLEFHQDLPNEFPADIPAMPIILGKSKCPLESVNSNHIPFHSISNHIYYDSQVQDIFGTQLVTFCLTKRWASKKLAPKNQYLQKYTTILYATYRTFNEFCPITIRKNDESWLSQSLHKDCERSLYDPYLSNRLIATTELFASIFT